jgi:hypothetical protein
MDRTYNVFISWSGERSRLVAEFLHGWVPKLVQAAKPWMSETDIDKGTRGLDEMARILARVKVGISCLTPENMNNPWILFEAGALSKTIDDKTRLCTFLIGDLQPHEIRQPLGTFQATRANKSDTLKLIQTINRALSDEPIPKDHIEELFDLMWPRLEETLSSLPDAPNGIVAERTTPDLLAEILEIVRAEASRKEADILSGVQGSVAPVSKGRGLTPGDPIIPVASPIATPIEAQDLLGKTGDQST